jgi:tRNA A37 methylthiotransferase MiaB
MPILVKLGTPRFRRFLMGLVPHKAVRRTQEIVDVMDRTSIQIFEHKRLALQQGDEAVLKQVGRGKDIMSILCKS